MPASGSDDLPRAPDRAIYTPPDGPPATGGVGRDLYDLVGEAAIFAMIEDMYLRLGRSDAAHLFPRGEAALREASKKTGAFFVFLFGGPPLYQQRHGRPMMRARHLPFEIDEAARRAWMACFSGAIGAAVERGDFPRERTAEVVGFLDGFSRWMVNVAPSET